MGNRVLVVVEDCSYVSIAVRLAVAAVVVLVRSALELVIDKNPDSPGETGAGADDRPAQPAT